MSASAALAPVVTAAEDLALERPRLGCIARRVGLSLLVACAIPAALFITVMRVAGVWPAIVVALVWAYGALLVRRVTGRRTSGLLVLTAVILTGRTVVALLAHSTFLYFLQPVLSDVTVAVVFLGSLATARPLVARLAGDFYPLDAELAARPRVRRLFWWLSLAWGLLCLGKATMTFWMLQALSLPTFVVAKSVSVLCINALAIAATIAVSVLVAHREGVLRPVVTA